MSDPWDMFAEDWDKSVTTINPVGMLEFEFKCFKRVLSLPVLAANVSS